MGYSMYRNLSQCYRVRSKTQKKIFQEALADPGTNNFSFKGFCKISESYVFKCCKGETELEFEVEFDNYLCC